MNENLIMWFTLHIVLHISWQQVAINHLMLTTTIHIAKLNRVLFISTLVIYKYWFSFILQLFKAFKVES